MIVPPVASELHAVAGVPSKANDDPIELDGHRVGRKVGHVSPSSLCCLLPTGTLSPLDPRVALSRRPWTRSGRGTMAPPRTTTTARQRRRDQATVIASSR